MLWNKKNVRKEPEADANTNIDEIDRKLLMILSMNGRASLSFMGGQVGLTVQATYGRIKRLEEKYGIRYILDLRREKLGYNRFLGFIKFSDSIPSAAELRAVINKQPKINFAAITNGAYDVIFYLTEETSDKAVDIIWKMESQSPLKKYNAEWTITPISSNYGYMPIGDAFFEVLKEKIWHRTRENKISSSSLLTEREFNVIKELNSNGSLNFTDVDKKHNFTKGTASYTYEKLEDRGIIKRTTITMEKLPIKYVAIIMLKYANSEEYEKTRKEFLREIIQYTNPTNKYTIVGDIGSPHSIVLFYPILKEGELNQTMEEIKSRIKGVVVTSLIISTVLLGSLCYRLFDNDYSRQHDILVSMKEKKSVSTAKYATPN